VLLFAMLDLDPKGKRVLLADGASLEYDSLVIAIGSQTSYFGHDAWKEWAPGLKSIDEAVNVRHKILYAFEVAERISDPVQRQAWLTFVIVGAGPTGVELAGAIGEMSRFTLARDFRHIDPKLTRVILIEAGPRILPSFDPALASRALRDLETLGIHTEQRLHDRGHVGARRGPCLPGLEGFGRPPPSLRHAAEADGDGQILSGRGRPGGDPFLPVKGGKRDDHAVPA